MKFEITIRLLTLLINTFEALNFYKHCVRLNNLSSGRNSKVDDSLLGMNEFSLIKLAQ